MKLSPNRQRQGLGSELHKCGSLLLLKWEELLAGLSLLVVVGSVGFGILSRHVLPTAATWTVELSTLAFTWAVFFGAAAAFRRDLHVKVDLIVLQLPPGPRALLGHVVNILILAFLAYTFYFAILLSISSSARPSPILRIPFTYVYSAVVVSFGSMILHQIVVIFGLARKRELS